MTSFSISAAPERYAACARAMGIAASTVSDAQAGERLIAELQSLNHDLSVPRLADIGISPEHWTQMISSMVDQAIASGSPANNPRIPTAMEVADLYRQVWAA